MNATKSVRMIPKNASSTEACRIENQRSDGGREAKSVADRLSMRPSTAPELNSALREDVTLSAPAVERLTPGGGYDSFSISESRSGAIS